MGEKQDVSCLVELGEGSQLKTELNCGVATLRLAQKSYHRPHLCLNGKEGLEVIQRISENPDGADTEFCIDSLLVHSGGRDGFWLNVILSVVLGERVYPTNLAVLTPRQTSHIIVNLSQESRALVLEKVRTWYFEKFLKEMEIGIQIVTEQFTEGDLLHEDSHGNRIFDIHSRRETDSTFSDFPYTEWEVVGAHVSMRLLNNFNERVDSYDIVDSLLRR
jgi:hypothetical protein